MSLASKIALKEPVFLVVIILLSRIPFLFAGYGSEEDSWGTPLAIWDTLEKGIYEPSRLPGHPVQEAFYLPIAHLGPFAYNLFSALACALACLAFYFIIRKLALGKAFLSALALGFTPVVFISSTYTIDYCFTLCFLLWSFFFLLENKLLIAGLFMAFAIGSRITAGAMIIPYLLWLYSTQNSSIKLKSTLSFVGVACTLSLLFYLPLIHRFGYRFFQYYDQFPYPSIEKVIYKATFGVWGVLGLLAIFSFFITQYIFFKGKFKVQETKFSPLIKQLFFTIFILFFISYIRLPQKSGYWIPLIPFAILALRVWLSDLFYTFSLASLILSSFVFSLGLTDTSRGSNYSTWASVHKAGEQSIFFDPITGPLYADFTKRKIKQQFCEDVIATLQSKPDSINNKIVICGWFYNELMVESKTRNLQIEPYLRFYIKKPELESLISKGYSLYYLSEQDHFNDLYSGLPSGYTQSKAKAF